MTLRDESPRTGRLRASSGMRAAALWLALTTGVASVATGAGPARAHSYKLGAIAIGHIWALPPEKDAFGVAVYGPILNRGKTTVRLVGVSSPIAAEARIRVRKDGHDTWQTSVELPPGKPRALASWREHIWLSGLKRRLKEGDSFDLTMDFGAAGRITVKVVVEKAKRR